MLLRGAARAGRVGARMDPAPDFSFDGWTLRRATGELLRDGRRTRLQQQPLAVLEELLQRPGELVTRTELTARLWPRGVVDFDTALNSAVRRLRTALDDHAEAPRYIETIPRRGYRFIGKLETVGNRAASESLTEWSPPPPAATVKGRLAIVMSAAVAAVAVVAAAVFAAGVKRDEPPTPEPLAPVSAPSEAADQFRLAEHFFQRRGPGDLDRARLHYERALELEPDHAAALAGLAAVYWIETVEGRIDPQQGLSRLRDAAERALALDPTLANAHLRLSQYRSVVGDRVESAFHARMAAALAPNDPLVLAFAASWAARDGRLEEAVELQRRALELEPLSRVTRYNLAWLLLMSGQTGEAGRQLRSLHELAPEDEEPDEAFVMVLVLEGRAEEALELVREWPDGRERWQWMAMTQHGLGRTEESEQARQALVDCCGNDDPLRVAEVHAFRGEPDAAFDWLRQGAAELGRPPWQAGTRRAAWVAIRSPLLTSLHDDPRWARWVESVQAPTSPDRMASRR